MRQDDPGHERTLIVEFIPELWVNWPLKSGFIPNFAAARVTVVASFKRKSRCPGILLQEATGD